MEFGIFNLSEDRRDDTNREDANARVHKDLGKHCKRRISHVGILARPASLTHHRCHSVRHLSHHPLSDFRAQVDRLRTTCGYLDRNLADEDIVSLSRAKPKQRLPLKECQRRMAWPRCDESRAHLGSHCKSPVVSCVQLKPVTWLTLRPCSVSWWAGRL